MLYYTMAHYTGKWVVGLGDLLQRFSPLAAAAGANMGVEFGSDQHNWFLLIFISILLLIDQLRFWVWVWLLAPSLFQGSEVLGKFLLFCCVVCSGQAAIPHFKLGTRRPPAGRRAAKVSPPG